MQNSRWGFTGSQRAQLEEAGSRWHGGVRKQEGRRWARRPGHEKPLAPNSDGGEKKKKTNICCVCSLSCSSALCNKGDISAQIVLFFPLMVLLVKQFIRNFYQIIGKKTKTPLLSPNSWGEWRSLQAAWYTGRDWLLCHITPRAVGVMLKDWCTP